MLNRLDSPHASFGIIFKTFQFFQFFALLVYLPLQFFIGIFKIPSFLCPISKPIKCVQYCSTRTALNDSLFCVNINMFMPAMLTALASCWNIKVFDFD